MHGSPIADLAQALSEGLSRPHHAWEAVTIVVAVAGGALLARLLRRSVDARELAASRAGVVVNALQFSIEGFRRLAFPVFTLLLLRAGELILAATHVLTALADARLLHLALSLVGALGLVRLFVYALRRALHDIALVAAFERGIALAVWLGVALYASGLLGDVVDWLQATRLPLGNSTVSLWSVLAGTATTLLSVLAAMWIGSLIEDKLSAAAGIETNVRVVLGRVLRALLIVLAVLLALSLSGIDLTVLSVFGGALGVGLGLGLQRIASNYVSGFILLLDHSLRIGDVITVDKYTGTVTQIRTRYTLLRALDGTEAVIPNEMLVSSPVANQSLSDPKVAVTVQVAIAYESDLRQAMGLLVAAAAAQQRVLAQPAPAAMLVEFGDNGLHLEVAFWIADPDKGRQNVKSEVALAIHERFKQAGIRFPYPWREVRLHHAARVDPDPDAPPGTPRTLKPSP